MSVAPEVNVRYIAVPILAEDFGIPVLTNPIAEAWRLIAAGIAPPVKGWGRLLANEPAHR